MSLTDNVIARVTSIRLEHLAEFKPHLGCVMGDER